ncbi:GNAT family N-acetyltransferase [Nocardioidaceae bacterium SCSIO 66511]|nr:GNAT family N-acetyltransferase [Nocardioidaceae bacterium SCSIO 66511]
MPGQAALVRRRHEDDLTELAQVLVRVHALDGYPVEGVADPEAWLTPDTELASWTAEYDGTIIGQITLAQATPDDDAAQVWRDATDGSIEELTIPLRLFVDPAHRDLGAGRDLMLAAGTYAVTHGRPIAFDVMLKDKRAIALYESIGCRRLGTITHRHSEGLTEPAAVYAGPEVLPTGPAQP